MLGAKDFGIDLGTDFIRIYIPGGNIITEPDRILYHTGTDQLAAVGSRAERLLAAEAERYIQYEIKDHGEIHDHSIVREALRYLIHAYQPLNFILKPDLLMAIPHGSSVIERKALKDLCIQAGFNEKGLYFIDELLASAIGAEVPVLEPVGNMVINIGAGNTQAGVFALGGLISSGSVHIGGRELSRQIVEHIRKRHDILIDIATAERAKKQIGSVLPRNMGQVDQMTLEGRNLRTGLPDSVDITTQEMREAIQPTVTEMINCIYEVLESTPPEISSDLMSNGIIATGGGVQMNGLIELLEERTKLKIHIAEHTSDAVIRGVQKVMQKPTQWSGIFSDLLQ